MGRMVRLAIIVILVFGVVSYSKVSAQAPTHTVQAGENLFRIALRYGVTVEALAAANGITDVTHVYVGQVLTIPTAGVTQPQPQPTQPDQSQPQPQPQQPQPAQPDQPVPAANGAPVYYTVQPGDTLSIISRKFGITYTDLVNANRIIDPNHIEPGQQIVVSGNAPTGGATVPNVASDPAALPAAPIPAPPTAVPAAPAPATGPTTYVVQVGEGLAAIGRKFNVPWTDIAGANNIQDPNYIYAGMTLRIPVPGAAPTTMETSLGVPPGPPPAVSGKYIKVVLHEQRVYVYENGNLLRNVLVSTGMPGTPTVQGDYKIYVKYTSQLMTGPGYYLPGVPWVMYFYEGYGLHGTYWHHNWGHTMSHGCVNMPTEEAAWLYSWAEVGTPVHVEW